MKPHSKHYSHLTGDERFRLYLAAMARDDEAEAAALGDTCPTHHYTMQDWSFHRRVDISMQVMTTLALELAPYVTAIRLLDWETEHLGDLLDKLAMIGFESAIEAHWAAIDPGGSPPKRLASGLPMPDIKQLMSGAVGSGFATVEVLQKARLTRRELAVDGVAVTLAGFDAFAREHWGLTADEAIATHAGLFSNLESAQPNDTKNEADSEAVKDIAVQFTRLWQSLCRDE
jgi:hypothetical protein